MSAYATSTSEKLIEAKPRWSGQIGSGGVADGTTTTIPLASAANLDNGDIYIFTINRVNATGVKQDTWEVAIGELSGTNFINCVRRVEGNATVSTSWSAGTVVEILFTAKHWNNLIDFLGVSFNSDGTPIADLPLTTPKITTAIKDANGNELIKATATASAVNEVTIANAATGNAPAISATGGDTDIDLILSPKGSGALRVPAGTYESNVTDDDDIPNKKYVDDEIAGIDGWNTYTAVVPTRASADDPTFVLTFAGVDLTTTIYPGMRIKWTQNSTVRYAIVTKMAFSTNTTMTVYGGTDYDVEDTGTHTISDFYYSTHKAPVGFPLDPTKWTLSNIDTSDRAQSNPVNDTWYNIGTTNNQLVIHTGLWRVYYQVNLNIQNTSDTFVSANVTLSTANDSESDSTMTAITGGGGATGTIFARNGLYRERILNLSSKATYYLNAKSTSGGTALEFLGSTGGPTIIRAVSAYL